MFENLPYTNFHELNLDWIIEVIKDFRSKYDTIQQIIDDGMEDLSNKANELENLLQAWYDTHSADIAQQLQTSINEFIRMSEAKGREVIASIPEDYTTTANQAETAFNKTNITELLPDNTDLNNVLEQANYRGDASTFTYANKPDGINSVFALHVFNGGGNFRLQVIWSYLDNSQIIYTRYRFGATPTWSAWNLVYDRDLLFELLETPALPNGTDLNELLDQKTYRGTADIYTYENIPAEVNSIFYLKVVNGTGNYRIQLLWQYVDNNQKIFTRYRFGATPTWSYWNKLYDQKEANTDQSFTRNTQSFIYGQPVISSSANNAGTKLKILEYNLAHYTNDTQYSTLAFIPSDKVFNLKKLIGKTSPDIMLACEDSKYIDGAPNITGSVNTKPSRTHVFSPVLPFEYGTEETFIRSKTSLTDGDTLKYTNDSRWLKYATATINNKTLLIICTHNTPTYKGYTEEQLINIRKQEYEELFKWAYREIQLTSYTTDSPVTAPTWDYCIIGGDFNSITNKDRTNLANYAWQREFSLSNGQWLGWIYTTGTNSIDNIICSSNIIINNIEVYSYLSNSLYSDHFPMAIDITLS